VRSFSDYARESTTDSVLLAMGFDGDNDSIVTSRSLTVAGRPAREFELAIPGSSAMRRSRVILNGTTLYRIDATVPSAQRNDPFVDAFFDSFTITERAQGDLFTDKLRVLLNDLTGADTARHDHAKRALNWFTPRTNEFPLLHETLRRLYHDAPDMLDSTRGQLLGLLAGGDSTSVQLLRSLVPDIPGDELGEGVDALIRIDSRESLDLLAELLTEHNEEILLDGNYRFYSLIYDPANTGVMFPRILRLLDDTDKSSQVLQLTASALDSSIIAPSVVEPYGITIARIMEEQLSAGNGGAGSRNDNEDEGDSEEESGDDAEAAYVRSTLLQAGARTLGALRPDDSTSTLLQRLLADNEINVRREAAVALMRRDGDVPEETITAIVNTPLQRIAMYRSCARAGIIGKFPEEYRTQEKIAEGLAVEWIYNDEESSEPEEIELVSAKQKEDGRYFVFRFRFSSEEDDPWYAAVVGPQPLAPTKIDAKFARSVTTYEKMDAMSVDEHIQAAIARQVEAREEE
jgi:HEAT repeat protein